MRTHVLIAAIFTLNAPLRALYCNGKGHKDPLAKKRLIQTKNNERAQSSGKPDTRAARSFHPETRESLHGTMLKGLVKLSDENKLEPVLLKIDTGRIGHIEGVKS